MTQKMFLRLLYLLPMYKPKLLQTVCVLTPFVDARHKNVQTDMKSFNLPRERLRAISQFLAPSVQ